jgi:alkyl hydroperoxide reductase subunit AhpC
MAWTFVCPTEIIAFSDRAADFAARGASVVFASTDSEYSLLAWTNASRKDGGLGPIKIPLLSDKNHQLSKDYGVLIEEEGIALRGLFVIDPNGVVRQVRSVIHIPWSSGIRYPIGYTPTPSHRPHGFSCDMGNCIRHLADYGHVDNHQ